MDETTNTPVGLAPAEQEPTEALKEKASEVGQGVREDVVDLTDRTRSTIRREIDRRSTEMGSTAREVASAVRRSSEELRQQGKDLPAQVVQKTAEGLDRAGSYLEAADADRIMQDVRDTGRRRPWLFVGAGALAGFAAARLLRTAGNGQPGVAEGSSLYQTWSGNGDDGTTRPGRWSGGGSGTVDR